MILNKQYVRRLGIYFFYDGDGIVDGFITCLLEDLKRSLERLVVVCNGKLTDAGRKKIEAYTDEIIVRENKGLDVWAYKTALSYVGWEACREYDEVVLCNSTMMGPVYPLSVMFSEMQEKDLDFWGITKTFENRKYCFDQNPYGYIPEHIQSYFIVYRKSLLESEELAAFWEEMPEIHSYAESIGRYESYFTKCFEEKGFRWDVYVYTDDLKGDTDQPIMFEPVKLIRERKCPVFKRRTFFHDYTDMLVHTAGEPALDLYEYLRGSGLYDTDLIWDNILRCYHLDDISRELHLNYTLSSRFSDSRKVSGILKKWKTAVIAHIYFEDIVEETVRRLKAFPEETDIYISTDTEEKKNRIRTVMASSGLRPAEIRLVNNRGRDVSAFLVGMRGVAENYDLVCFFHDKKTTQSAFAIGGRDFAEKCFDNIMLNGHYVENIIELFADNPRMGLAVPPAPMHGEYRSFFGNNWGKNLRNTIDLCRELDVNVPVSEYHNPIAPYGSVFWFRPAAMKRLLNKEWTYDDFPQEPLPEDGTVSHAVERSYPYVAQAAGYYTAVVLSDSYMRIEYTNLRYIAEQTDIVEKYNSLEQRLTAVYNSTSWKMSKPIRSVGDIVKRITGKQTEDK